MAQTMSWIPLSMTPSTLSPTSPLPLHLTNRCSHRLDSHSTNKELTQLMAKKDTRISNLKKKLQENHVNNNHILANTKSTYHGVNVNFMKVGYIFGNSPGAG
jgi:hypothetical protein